MSNAAIGAIFCLVYTTLFSAHYLVVKEMLGSVSAFELSALRGLFGGLLLFLIFFPKIRREFRWSLLPKVAALALLGFGLNQVLFLQGIRLTTPAHAALISNTIPIVSLLLAMLVGQEKGGLYRWIGFALAFISLAALLFYQQDFSQASVEGDLLIFASVICLSASFLLAKRLLGSVGSEVISPLMLLMGAVFFSLLSAFHYGTVWDFAVASPRNLGLFLFEVLGSTALAYFLNMAALRRLKVSTATAFSYLQLPITALLGFVFYGVKPETGTFLVLVGLAIAAWLIFLDENPEAQKGASE